MKISKYLVASEVFLDELTGRARRIILGTRTSEVRVLDEASWRDLEGGRLEALPEKDLNDLVDAEILVPDWEDELATILGQNVAACADDDQLYLVVQPSASCQLGCDYCGQSHTSMRLSQEDQDHLVNRVRGKLGARVYRKFFVAWFGGEPLAGLSVIRSLTPRFRALARDSGISYGAKMVTNGLALSHDVASEVVAEHAVEHIEITLDGTSEFHDRRRHRKNGTPTFDKIFTNLLDLARRDDLELHVSVRCNVDRRNAEGVSPLIRTLAEAGLQDRISFYVASVYSWGNDAHRLAIPPEEFASLEVGWLAEMITLGFRPGLIPSRKSVLCLATMPEADLVDAYGSLFNCTEVSYVPTYGTPNVYSIGTVAGGEVPGKRSLLGDFNEQIGRGEYPCASCRMLPVCGGSCPKKWQEGLDPCPSTKRNIQDRLLLHYAVHRLNSQGEAASRTLIASGELAAAAAR
ncbi:radical SAM protein [Singulisphaera sp. Ch08]|uniref:Radical SAM protein n=1 Tax=Singulisphaera sp. Ch08 TaxID=3120278 RepID=A0AAU7CLA9_9BACT